jgi:hypothetical protein
MHDIKCVIYIVLPLVFVSLVYGVSSTPDACALPPDPKRQTSTDCKDVSGTLVGAECCWTEDDGEKYCQTCWNTKYDSEGNPTEMDCDPKELQMRLAPGENLPTLQQVPPTPLFGGGDLPTLEQVPPTRTLPGGGDIPTLQPQGEPTLPVICSKEAGLEKDPETGQCVPIERPPPSPPWGEDAEPTEEPEEQSSDGGGGEEQSEQEEQ